MDEPLLQPRPLESGFNAGNSEAPDGHLTDAREGSEPRGASAEAEHSSMMETLKATAKRLKCEVLALNYAIQDRRTPWLPKLLSLLTLAYALSPIDLIPDFIPVLGLLDDLLLLPGMIWASIALIPAEVMEDARHRAQHEPVLLHRNMPMALLICTLWGSGLLWLEYVLLQHYAPPQVLRWQSAVLAGSAAAVVVVVLVWIVLQLRKEKRRQTARATRAPPELAPAHPQPA